MLLTNRFSTLLTIIISSLIINTDFVLAQRASERFPTNAEIQQIIREFQQRASSIPYSGECCAGWEDDMRTTKEKQPRESFVRGWAKINPTISPFLGYWVNNDAEITVYPSTVKNRVCVVWETMGSEPTYHLSLGSLTNNYIYLTTGTLKNTVLIHQKNKKGVSFLLLVSVHDNQAFAQPGSDIYADPRMGSIANSSLLPNSINQQLKNNQCTRNIPK